MNPRFRALSLTFAIIAFATTHSTAQSVDAQLGTWVLNVAKSRFTPGPPPRSNTRRFERMPDGKIRYTSDVVDRNGTPRHVEYLANFDGKDYPVSGSTELDTIALKPVDAYTLAVTETRNGKVVITGTRTISKDGKTATVTNKGVDSKEQQVDNIQIFDKR